MGPTSSTSTPGPRSTSPTRSSSSASRSCSARSCLPIVPAECMVRGVATLRFTVAEDEAGSRLDRALAARSEIGTRSLSERLLREGAGRVDGTERAKSHRLEPGAVVEVVLPGAPAQVEPAPVTVPVAYEDEHLVVLDKPPGLMVHPARGVTGATLLPQLLT